MPEATGHIELERTIDSIIVGHRHRDNLGDIDALMKSIAELGLLQPVTITPDGILVCGRRRLEAVKRLGWRTLRVWVRSGISDDLSRLLAEHDENNERKELDEVEQARLFEEIDQLMAEDGARRQKATRFGHRSGGDDGGGDSPPPQTPAGKSRDQAAHMVTGSASYHRHQQVNFIRHIAEDPDAPPAVREVALREIAALRAGGKVHGSYIRVKEALARADAEARMTAPDPAVDALSRQGLARAKQEEAVRRAEARERQPAPPPRDPSLRTVRAFVLTWRDLDGWTQHYDAAELAEELSDADWQMFQRVLSESEAFAESIRSARDSERESGRLQSVGQGTRP